MNHLPEPYFDMQQYGEIVLLSVGGLWDVPTARAYEQFVIQSLKSITNKRVFSIVSLRQWSLPPLEVLEIVNASNKFVKQNLSYEHHAIISPIRNRKLFTEISQDFNHGDMEIHTRSFLRYQEAVDWGKSLGYDFDQVPDDYIKQLEAKY